jgi:hypothetical protein
MRNKLKKVFFLFENFLEKNNLHQIHLVQMSNKDDNEKKKQDKKRNAGQLGTRAILNVGTHTYTKYTYFIPPLYHHP